MYLYNDFFLVAQMVRICLQCRRTWVQSLGQENPLQEEMASHSSILAWRIRGIKEPDGLQCRKRVGTTEQLTPPMT